MKRRPPASDADAFGTGLGDAAAGERRVTRHLLRDAVLRILEDAYRRPPGLASSLTLPGDEDDRRSRVGMAIRIDACAIFDHRGPARRTPLQMTRLGDLTLGGSGGE